MVPYKVLCNRLFSTQRCTRSGYLNFLNDIAVLSVCCNALGYKQFSSVIPDTVDIFAETLVQDKARKWKIKKLQKKLHIPMRINANSNCFAEDNVSSDEMYLQTLANSDSESCKYFISAALRDGRHTSVVILLHLCRKIKRELPQECLLEAASSFSRIGVIDGVKAVQMLCKATNAKEFSFQSGYSHYIAEAKWICGNLQEALNLFTSVYGYNPHLRKKIRSMSRFLINDVISRQGEAALVLVTRFATYLAQEHEDYNFLMILWQCCFLSNSFADQTLAAKILEEHSELLSRVEESALEMSFISLRSYRSEPVYRLLEVLLLYKMRTIYCQVLRALFDYKCDQHDVQACCNIMQCCKQLEVSLTVGQQQKFIYLVIVGSPTRNKKLQADEMKRQCNRPPEFRLKF